MASSAAYQQTAAAQTGSGVPVNWLGGPPPLETGVSFGVPWPRGTVRKDQPFSLTSADGKSLPLQSWPLAYWPDGSMKFTGFATVAGPAVASARLAPGNSAPPAQTIRVNSTGATIAVD